MNWRRCVAVSGASTSSWLDGYADAKTGFEGAQLLATFWREGDDVAALVFGVDSALDQVVRLKLRQRRSDIAAIDSGTATQVGLARGPPLFERRKQTVVVAAKAAPMGLEAGVEQP